MLLKRGLFAGALFAGALFGAAEEPPVPPTPTPVTDTGGSSPGGSATVGRHKAEAKRDNTVRLLKGMIGERALHLTRSRKDEMELMAILTILIDEDLL